MNSYKEVENEERMREANRGAHLGLPLPEIKE
jgi:hypothetical protein